MKKGILLICLFAGMAANAQDFEKMRQEQRAKDSISQLSQGNADPHYASSTTLTRFVGFNYNKVMPSLEYYLEEKAGFASADALFGMVDGWLRTAYTPQIDNSKEQRFVYVLAKLNPEGIIQQMQIKGDWSLIVPIFCDYWPTKLDFNNLKKGEIVSVYNIDERITLSSSASGANCIITIRKIAKK